VIARESRADVDVTDKGQRVDTKDATELHTACSSRRPSRADDAFLS
jgi:hypothetical protein